MTGFYWIYESSESTGFQLDSRVTGLDSATQVFSAYYSSISIILFPKLSSQECMVRTSQQCEEVTDLELRDWGITLGFLRVDLCSQQ